MAIAAAPQTMPIARGVPASEGGLSLRDILAALRRRLRVIVTTGLCGAILGVAASSQLPRTYESAAVVAVDSMAPAFETADGQPDSRGGAVANKIELIKSRFLMGQVVDEMRLTDDPLFSPPQSVGALDIASAYLLSWVPEDWLVRVGRAADRSDGDPVRSATPPDAREIAIDRLQNSLTVTQPPGAEMLQLTVRANGAAQSADIANAVAVAYVSAEKEHQHRTAVDAAGLMRQELGRLQKDVVEAERAVAEFRNSHGLAASGTSGGTLNDQRVVDLRAQLVALRGEQIAKQGQLQRARAALIRGGDALADLGSSAPLVLTLRSQQS